MIRQQQEGLIIDKVQPMAGMLKGRYLKTTYTQKEYSYADVLTELNIKRCLL